MNCLEEKDLSRIRDSFLAGFDQRIAAIPSDVCTPFYEEARILEAELLAFYRLIVTLAAKADPEDLSAVAALWRSMVGACDGTLTRLRALHQQHPMCGADIFLDRALDLRNKCSRLQTLHS